MLVTPPRKLEIEVETTTFRAIEMQSEGQGRDRRIGFQLDSGDAVIPGPEHPLRMAVARNGPCHVSPSGTAWKPSFRARSIMSCEIALWKAAIPSGHMEQRTFFPLLRPIPDDARGIAFVRRFAPTRPCRRFEGNSPEDAGGAWFPRAVLVGITDRGSLELS